ncbi:MAG: hypothetical protein AB8G26_18480 [Ilumatobacter sp.]
MSDERYDEEYDSPPGPAGWSGPSIWLILFILFAAAGVVFSFQNGQDVETEFLWLDGEFKLWVTILASIVLGIVLDRLILTWWRRARRSKDD